MEMTQKTPEIVPEKPETGAFRLLRFLAAGSVDDGKSTLIGRLLHDSQAVRTDQLAAITRASNLKGQLQPDLSLLTDGLKEEREKGITIDVAYRYFATPNRKFIVADTPGHWEFTRNMVTGASNSDLILLLTDARKGLLEQTRRHILLASLLGIRHVVLCVNKMDLVAYSETVFAAIAEDFRQFTQNLNFAQVVCLPVSALQGDNIVTVSRNMPWFTGPTLLQELEQTIVKESDFPGGRFPVQLVLENENKTYLAGRVESGKLSVGQRVRILPGGEETVISAIETMSGTLSSASAGRSVSVVLGGKVPLKRGDWLVTAPFPQAQNSWLATICWFPEMPLAAGHIFLLKHTTRQLTVTVVNIISKTNVQTLAQENAADGLRANEIGLVEISAEELFYFDFFAQNKTTGSFILIHPETFETVAAGMIG